MAGAQGPSAVRCQQCRRAAGATRGSGILQRPAGGVYAGLVGAERPIHVCKMGCESPMLRKVKVHLPHIASGRLCVFECGVWSRKGKPSNLLGVGMEWESLPRWVKYTVKSFSHLFCHPYFSHSLASPERVTKVTYFSCIYIYVNYTQANKYILFVCIQQMSLKLMYENPFILYIQYGW